MKYTKRLLVIFSIFFTIVLSSCMFFHGAEHEYGDDIVDVEPTCTEAGKGHRICSKCNFKEEFDIPALGHEYTQYTIETEPTCEEKGLKKRTCTRCNHVDEVEIDALGHHFDDPIIVIEATCTDDGLMVGECTRCHKHTEEVVPALGHDFEGATWTILVPGDCTHPGQEKATCNRCHQEITVNYGGSHNYEDSVFYNDLGHGVIKSKCSGCDDCYYKGIEVDYTKLYGYKKLGTYSNGDKLQAMYKKIYEDLDKVFDETKDYTNEDSVIASYAYTDYGLTDNEATIVYSTFNNENYQFYFVNPGFTTSIQQTMSGDTVISTTKTLKISMNSDYYLRSKREDYESKLENELKNLSNYLKEKTSKELIDMTDYEKIRYIHDYLCNELTYAKTTSGQPENSPWAHSIEGLLYKRKGVCETYSEAYQLFSLVFGIETITVSGKADGGSGFGAHKWNYTYFNDKWYLMDVTWDDQTTVRYDYWLVGQKADHEPTPTDVNNPITDNVITFQINLPELASTRYIPYPII